MNKAQHQAILALRAADKRYFVTVSKTEPPSSDEEPYLPIDGPAWLRWKAEEFDPASEELKAAKGIVAVLFEKPDDWFDTSFPGHRMNYMPWIDKMLRTALRTDEMPKAISRHLPF